MPLIIWSRRLDGRTSGNERYLGALIAQAFLSRCPFAAALDVFYLKG